MESVFLKTEVIIWQLTKEKFLECEWEHMSYYVNFRGVSKYGLKKLDSDVTSADISTN